MSTYAPGPYGPPAAYAPPSNGLGVAAFVCSLIGLFTGGLLSPIGLILGLVALGRPPRGLAIAGVVLGFLGTCGGLILFLIFGAALLAILGIGVLAFTLANAEKVEVSADMAQIAAQVLDYREKNDGVLPATLTILHGLRADALVDPWGRTYRYILDDELDMGFDVISDGEDGRPETLDDIRLSRLGEVWGLDGNVSVSGGEGGAVQLRVGDKRINIRGGRDGGSITVDVDGQTHRIGGDGQTHAGETGASGDDANNQ
ncbi:MAG: type II secretion system protein GspG [Phycisphaeraceae bacterium]|nr:type II secretion system protein GspG [Phycisphaerales bacterium]QOJ17518.1 MAG: type II secretion system protein GspG [Phycisphaeraceae bacterium]